MNIRYTIPVQNLAKPVALAVFLMHHTKGFKKQNVALLFHKRWVLLNDEIGTENSIVNNGDEIKILTPYTTHAKIFAEDIPLQIVEETPHWLVVNKPTGMACHGGLGSYWGTLLNALVGYYEKTGQTPPLQNGLVHRLDKYTSGLMVVAKTEEGRETLLPQFRNKTAVRKYTALVHGIVEQNEGTINIPIGRNPADHLDIRAYPDGEHGKTAITHYKVLQRLATTTLLECVLETGRTNQIRIHMQYIGHSIVGDKRYPPPQGLDTSAARLMLHAYYLIFDDLDGQKKVFENIAGF